MYDTYKRSLKLILDNFAECEPQDAKTAVKLGKAATYCSSFATKAIGKAKGSEDAEYWQSVNLLCESVLEAIASNMQSLVVEATLGGHTYTLLALLDLILGILANEPAAEPELAQAEQDKHQLTDEQRRTVQSALAVPSMLDKLLA